MPGTEDTIVVAPTSALSNLPHAIPEEDEDDLRSSRSRDSTEDNNATTPPGLVPDDTANNSPYTTPSKAPPASRSAAYAASVATPGDVEANTATPTPPFPAGRILKRRNTYTAQDLARIADIRKEEPVSRRQLRLAMGVFLFPLLAGVFVAFTACVGYSTVSHSILKALAVLPSYKLPEDGIFYLVSDAIVYRHDIPQWHVWVWMSTLCVGAVSAMAVTTLILWALYDKTALKLVAHALFASVLVIFIYFALLATAYLTDKLGDDRAVWDTMFSYIVAGILVSYILYVVDRRFCPGFFWPGFLTITAGLILAFLYSNILVPVVYSGLDSTGRAVFRLVIHPLLWEPALLLSRHFARHSIRNNEGNTEWLVVAIWFTVAQLWGRFLVTSESNLLVAFIISFLLAIQEVALRLTVKRRDRALTKLFWWNKPKELIEDVFDQTQAKRLRLDVMLLDTSTEFYSIAVSAGAAVLYNLSDSHTENVVIATVLANIAIQLVIEMITDAVVLFIEIKYLKLDIFLAYDARCQLYHVYQLAIWMCMTLYWLNGFAGLLCWRVKVTGYWGGISEYCQ